VLRRPILLISLAAITLTGVGADLSWRMYNRPQIAVVNDGILQAAASNPNVAQSALGAILAHVTPGTEILVNVLQKLSIRPAAGTERLPLLSSNEIMSALAQTTSEMASAQAITVNGQDVVAVKDEMTAQMVRDRILDEYKTTILRDASAIETVNFRETIAWRSKMVPVENIRTGQEAINILKLGTDKLVLHVVKPGDTGWDIARSHQVSTEDLAKANPSANIYVLQIGQELNVTFKEPYVHTESVSTRVVKERIPFTEQISKDSSLWPWQYQVVTPGVSGTRQLTIREYRDGGRLVKSEVIENLVLLEPKPQVAKQGTKQIPDLGTGSLVYPVAGTTTSYYGARWGGFHNGVDIGAPSGTPILAADNGMVIFKGWSGNYGNLIQIDHGGGSRITWYAHLSSFAVNTGATVKKGDVIGYVGSTGYSTGPHLHFEVHVNGISVNPLQFYK
jgi:murein DD-endopeptidase MepM/ murein hydrolase activator NlpD